MAACRYYSVDEAAEYLELSRHSVYRLVTCHKIGCHRPGLASRPIKFTQAQLDAYLDSTRVDPAGQPARPAHRGRRRQGRQVGLECRAPLDGKRVRAVVAPEIPEPETLIVGQDARS